MKNKNISRRRFVKKTAAAGAIGAVISSRDGFPAILSTEGTDGRLALHGGKPVRSTPFPAWPVVEKNDEEGWMEALHAGKWCRLGGNYASKFEEIWSRQVGTKYALVTNGGTTALHASLNALDVGPGDEVIVPPYTFVATINVVLLQYALPVFVDTDPETFQINSGLIDQAITDRTRAILPVHLGGNPANMDEILAVAKKHNLPVLEDACQAHTAEWRHRRVGSLGSLGCFSFQASKNLNSGEGGAVVGDDEVLMKACNSFHNNGRGELNDRFAYIMNGTNCRMTEFQAALLLQQIVRFETQSRQREENAKYLTRQLNEIPGILPAREYEGCTRNGYHLYMFRYQKEAFATAPRRQFLKALSAEGIPCGGGYSPLNKEPIISNVLNSRAGRRVFSQERLSRYFRENEFPANDKLCNEEGVWFAQTMFLGDKNDMDHISGAIRKIKNNADQLAKA